MEANAATAADRRRADRLLLEVARSHRVWTLITAAGTLAGSVLVVLLPTALARAIDAVTTAAGPVAGSSAGATGPIARFAVLLAALLAADLLAEFGRPYCAAAATASLRHRLLDRILAAGPAATRRFAPGDLVGRLVGSAPDAANAPTALVTAAADLVMSAGGIVALGLIDWRLVPAFAVTVPVGVLILRAFVRQTADLAAAYQHTQSEIAARLLDALSGIRTIRASGTREIEAARVLAPVPRLSEVGHRLWRSQRVAGWRSMLLFAITQSSVLAVAGLGLVQGRLAAGQVLAAASYAALGLGFFSSTQAALALSRARGAALRLAEADELPRPGYGSRDLPPQGPGELVFRQVAVHGEHGPVIEGLDLVVRGGTELAVVGAAGSGKSVLAALAGRLLDPDAGTVLLDGVPLPQFSRAALRGAVTYAFERPAPVGESVRDSIALGGHPQRVEAAARAACADGFIRKLPEGYETPLEQAPFSGGEIQRLGLARALASTGETLRVIVLDDATAALDTVTESRVSAAMGCATAGRTRIVVAHRAAAAARADLVAWMEGGRLRALGPHRELWSEPEYRALLGADEDAQTQVRA
ncbi:ABC transporter ATP-binding protein [Actinocrinis puniceicyclus]|uniref:ABC transporter ATP-binding protein n=1 Tax=Actinocrinis puniceicyclus TaxID=977794 RepID=A0A8J7WNQ4_9ACTN|nr:ABC transporter ATP-binding protein [Actinocrinis puniceicyclus]MBS2964115.1 ABC transporter ATP-binding protein [Actinocrinis puniceicyclus]